MLQLMQVNASTPADSSGQRQNLIEAAHTNGTTTSVPRTPPDDLLLASAVLASDGDDSSKDSCFPMAEGASATLARMRAAFVAS